MTEPAATEELTSAEFADLASEALIAGDGLVVDERDPRVPQPVRDLWGFYRTVAIDRPWILRGVAIAEVATAALLVRRSRAARRSGRSRGLLPAFGAVALVSDAAAEMLMAAYLGRRTDSKGNLVIPPRPAGDADE
jgi:hypothetical protein